VTDLMSEPHPFARRIRWVPRRCARCRRWLPRHRVRLGLTYCSGPCYAALYQRKETPDA
jgi:hypothetical protein